MSAPKIIFKIYLVSALIFGFFRSLLFFYHKNEVFDDGISTWQDIVSSFVMGLRYDLLVTGFVVVIPYLLLVAYDFTAKKFLKKTAFWWLFVLLSLGFMLAAGNVTYYNKFYQPITLKAFEWFDQPAVVLGMIFQEPKYWFMFIPFGLVVFLFYRLLNGLFIQTPVTNISIKKKSVLYFVFFVLIFISIRGTVLHAPLRAQDAFTQHNNFLNELKLNPVFVLEKSYENFVKDKLHPIQLMPVNEAVAYVQKQLHVDKPVNANPISRSCDFDSVRKPRNVVIVLMESMAAWKMKYFGNTENRTPFLDSLFMQGISFSNMYSNGVHTYAGIYGVHYAYPEIFDKHPLKGVDVKQYYGLPQILKQKAYQTAFFIPHNKDFDNLGAFLSKNGFDKIYFEKDYPKDSIRNVWGVDDHFLLNFALKKIDRMARQNKAFLATILTISDHGPFYIPDYIKGDDDYVRATRFADWSLRDFFNKARKRSWFDNTLFVFVADHGEAYRRKYPVPLTYNHIPAIFYYKGVQPVIIEKTAGQLDIFPMIMHLLQSSYINMSFGQNLFKDTRPYIYFNNDKEYGIIDDNYLLVLDRHKTIGLYRYKEGDLTNYMQQEPEKTQEMETYLKAHIQTAQYILDNNLQTLPTP